MPSHPSESPAKKQSKWSPEEDALIIDLRGNGMKWEDISKRLPGRSAISCRLHYQNYLERRSEWDEERKNKLARLYERFKPDMWARVAEELAVPWRAAEAMHWQLGEAEMARRAGVTPFLLSGPTDPSSVARPPIPIPAQGPPPQRPPPNHSHSLSQGSAPSYPPPPPGPTQQPFRRMVHTRIAGPTRPLAARRESTPRSAAPSSPNESVVLASMIDPTGRGGPAGRGSSNDNSNGNGRGNGTMLPGFVEMTAATTRSSPYGTPAYSVTSSMSMSLSGGGYPSPTPMLPNPHYRDASRSITMAPEVKRSRSPDDGREMIRRRHYD